MAFDYLGVTLKFEGKGIHEKGIVTAVSKSEYNISLGQEVIGIDEKYFRPTEVELLIGDASKAFKKLGWKPDHKLEDLVYDMMKSDLNLMKKESYLKKGGYTIMNYFE